MVKSAAGRLQEDLRAVILEQQSILAGQNKLFGTELFQAIQTMETRVIKAILNYETVANQAGIPNSIPLACSPFYHTYLQNKEKLAPLPSRL